MEGKKIHMPFNQSADAPVGGMRLSKLNLSLIPIDYSIYFFFVFDIVWHQFTEAQACT
jgi:hypothetical protein